MINSISIQFPLDPKSINSEDLQNINNVLLSIGLRCEKIEQRTPSQESERTVSNPTVQPSKERKGPASKKQIDLIKNICAEQKLNPEDAMQKAYNHGIDQLSNKEAHLFIQANKKKQDASEQGF